MRIALLFNGRAILSPQTSAEEADDRDEEYDSAETIAAIADALRLFGDVIPIEADRHAVRRLVDDSFDFVFNVAEGSGRRCREAHAAALCELLDIPFSHSDTLTLAVTLDKAIARRVVSPEVAVAPAVLVAADQSPATLELLYPVIVKPNDEGSSKGIRGDSVATCESEARRLIARVQSLYRCPVLVEEYLDGAEVTVGVIGNGEATRVLGVMEIAAVEKSPHFIYSVEVKRDFRRRVNYFMPPRLDRTTIAQIEADALTAYRLLGCRDVARLDFRLDATGRPHFLECNPLPGLNPDSSDLVILSRPTWSHAGLVQQIARCALQRHALVPA